MKKPLRIVVADDEQDMREYLRELIPRMGHEVAGLAENGRRLVDQCRKTHPDLVIADIRMPDMDGIEAAAAINRDRPTPVILVSAHDDEALVHRAAAEHILAYLVKPVKEADLRTAVSLAMQRFSQFLALAHETDSLRQALEDRKLIEKAKGILMKRLRVEEEDAFRRLRKLANDKNMKLIEVARMAASSDEVFQALEKV